MLALVTANHRRRRLHQSGESACSASSALRERLVSYPLPVFVEPLSPACCLPGTRNICQRDLAFSISCDQTLARRSQEPLVTDRLTDSFPGNLKRPAPFTPLLICQSGAGPHSGLTPAFKRYAIRHFIVKENGWSLKPQQKTQSRLSHSIP